MEGRVRAAPVLAIAMMLLASLAVLPASAKEADALPLIDQITVENGTTDAFGGGNQLLVRIGNQAFGVVYGGEGGHEGYVTFYAAVVRTLGTADVYERSGGRLVGENVPLPVVTVVAQRMIALVEFRDVGSRDGSPGDGIFNFRPNLSTPEVLDFNVSEPLHKSLQLSGTWELTGFELTAAGHDAVRLNYSITLEDVSYTHVADREHNGDGTVEKVAFHVRMLLERHDEELPSIPHFDAIVALTRHGRELVSIVPDGTSSGTATVTSAHLKIDHEIVGWDASPPLHDAPSRLLLITAIRVLNGISDRLAPWLNDLALRDDRAGSARANLGEGDSVEMNPTRPVTDSFARVASLDLHDNWREMAHLRLLPTVDVWPHAESEEPETGKAFFQLLGGVPVADRIGDTFFRGFLLFGGFSYPTGYRVFHDPEIIAEGVELHASSILPDVLPAVVMAAQFAVIALSVLGAVGISAYFGSSRARARARRDHERLQALKERYRLRPGGDGR